MRGARAHPESLKTFGRTIFTLRQERKFSQDKFAEKIGVSTRYLQSLEAGEHFPGLNTLRELRKQLGTDWNDLFVDL